MENIPTVSNRLVVAAVPNNTKSKEDSVASIATNGCNFLGCHSDKLISIQTETENKHRANLAQECRKDLIQEARKWIQVVADIEACADHQTNKALSTVLET